MLRTLNKQQPTHRSPQIQAKPDFAKRFWTQIALLACGAYSSYFYIRLRALLGGAPIWGSNA